MKNFVSIKRTLVALGAAAGLCSTFAAHADRLATASISNIQVELIDLDLTDSATPFLNWGYDNTNLIELFNNSPPSWGNGPYIYGSTPTPGGGLSSMDGSAEFLVGAAYVQIVDGRWVTYHQPGGLRAYVEGNAPAYERAIQASSNTSPFGGTLSALTKLVITADLDVYQGGAGKSFASLAFARQGLDGSSEVLLLESPGGAATSSHKRVTFEIINQSASTLGIDAQYVTRANLAAVPEPDSVALLLAGVVIITATVASRRRLRTASAA